MGWVKWRLLITLYKLSLLDRDDLAAEYLMDSGAPNWVEEYIYD